MSLKISAQKNVPYWSPDPDDYELVFCDVNGLFRECSHNIHKYNDILLSDYLLEMNIVVPDYTQFLRIINDSYIFEYRSLGGRVRIDFRKRSVD